MMSSSKSMSASNDTREWGLCFLCQSDLKESTTKPSTSIKLKNKPKRILACYEKVIDNIRQLNEFGELPNSIFTDDIVGVGADSDSPNIVQKVVWHKTCRNSIDTQKVQRARKRSEP